MNQWIKKSFELAADKGYLDKLSAIYPVSSNAARALNQRDKNKIFSALKESSGEEMINSLLEFKRFPFDDPYIGYFRQDRAALSKNPKTVARIKKRLLALGGEGIIKGIERPKSSSRQFGQYFRNFLEHLEVPILQEDEFIKSKEDAILAGGDKALKRFAKDNLGYKKDKGLDLVMRIGGQHYIGEAKFISATGGTQDKSFRESLAFIKAKSHSAQHIAILDGVIWAPSSRKQNLYGRLKKLHKSKIVLSALLLRDFLKSQER